MYPIMPIVRRDKPIQRVADTYFHENAKDLRGLTFTGKADPSYPPTLNHKWALVHTPKRATDHHYQPPYYGTVEVLWAGLDRD